MDVSIGHLRLAGRVVGDRDRAPAPAVVQMLTGPAARQRLYDKLTGAFEGDEVVVLRSLECFATVRNDTGAAEALASSITASAVRLLRDHPADDDRVVRFADEAAYVAAYVHDYLDGRQDRWYYQAFEPYRRRDGTPDLASLLAAHRRAHRLRILAEVRRRGDLDAVLELVGEQRAEDLVSEEVPARADWSPLVATAVSIVAGSTGQAADPGAAGIVARLAAAEPPPDWRDAGSLGDAVAAATVAMLSSLRIAATDELVRRLVTAAAEHEWFDRSSFEQGLALRRLVPAAGGASGPGLDRGLSSRARQVLATLQAVAADPQLRLDPARPESTANHVRLLAALVEVDPRWDDDELARALARQVLDRWAAGDPPPAPTVAPTSADRPRAGQSSAGGAGQTPPGSRAGARRPRPADVQSTSRPVSAPSLPSPPAMQAVIDVLADRFPRPPTVGGLTSTASAPGLLLLRGAVDLGLTPYLLDPTASGRPLLSDLLDRWSGQMTGPDPLHDLLVGLAGETPRVSRLDDACRLAARRLVDQGHVREPLLAVTVPHGNSALVTVPADESGRLLPFASLEGAAGLRRLLEQAGASIAREGDEADVRAPTAAALSSVCLTTGTADEIELDLLAVACVQAWARWLPGFSGSSVPYLLDTVVRRPAGVAITAGEVAVSLPARSHDVVLRMAGYLEPIEACPVLGRRDLRFVTWDDHGR